MRYADKYLHQTKYRKTKILISWRILV